MTWTDERVALLKKLWMEGLSASQIAAELSGGVTRNAVIGKVHRLKLSARAKPASVTPRAKAPRPAAPRRPSAPSGPRGTASAAASAVSQRRTTSAPTMGATALKIDAEMEMEAVVETTAKVAELFIPVEERISLLQLTEKTCKWPIGDPMSSEFHFCGRDSDEGKPYCEFHSRRAYHQIDRRKR
ncbi:GcrA cell cycle regulator [Pelagibacterium sp. 26DY04]|uniref:GcrA family cell cycle regulator n=1 Tax=unclassified Pelagibacterium TaxID=2623280 RepID=UPI0028149CF3|nr:MULTISPECIES: GcrA family cell cycle regulator [unclassified Pelagibacterium]WMT87634.1 GcrA cell cycle regulator [Pelagibacterium sp. 26DY04]WMT91597.1 GcrA cell cycle regulator [Pelagibacterium sp. H642]